MRLIRGAALAWAVMLTSGCASLFPRSEAITKSPWKSYDEAQAAFDRIVPFQTTVSDLKSLGFDPGSCIEARAACRAAELDLTEARSRRFGNLLLDLLGFNRRTHETGWQFKAFLLIRGDVVVYKLAAGQPAIDRFDKRVRPLGPLQELDWIFRWGFGQM